MEGFLTVGKAAQKIGLSAKSIRYYESRKLIPRAKRSPSGYRLYPPETLRRLDFIRKAKSIGFTLADIRKIFNLSDRGQPCCDQVCQWSERRLRELGEQIQFLTQLRNKVIQYRKVWRIQTTSRNTAVPEAEICRLIAGIKDLPERL